jgi:endonuclease/exonuclease/phosphatase family metal-dependent hydrolase
MILATWNVLHRIHAIRHAEPVIARWPEEDARIAAIADFIAGLSFDVLCLQEVSGDQLDRLRASERGTILATAHARVPSPRGLPPSAALRDPTEHLVTIVREGPAQIVDAGSFDTDPGKGFHSVSCAGDLRVINTHVSWGERHHGQCARLATAARGATRLGLCGDFNAPREVCLRALDADVAPAIPARPGLATRPGRDPGAGRPDIDHVFVRGMTVLEARVLDAGGRSDHHILLVGLDGALATRPSEAT